MAKRRGNTRNTRRAVGRVNLPMQVVSTPRIRYYEISSADVLLTGLFQSNFSYTTQQLWPDLMTSGNRQIRPLRYVVTFSPVNLLTVPVMASLSVYSLSGIVSGVTAGTIQANASNQVALSPTLPVTLATRKLESTEKPILTSTTAGQMFQVSIINPTITSGLRVVYTIAAWGILEPDLQD
jgi:hypothetical protein